MGWEIVLIIIGGLVSFMFAILAKQINKLRQTNDERHAQRVDSEYIQMQAYNAIDGLTLAMADALHRKGICNGELKELTDAAKAIRAKYFEHINKQYLTHKEQK